jgi:2',3'-cyclic-nucleotide 2'-phosphodiesterase (5'-nucleotidase family)
VVETASKLQVLLHKEHGVDTVVPMTHQVMADDRAMAEVTSFPVLIGAHDHNPYNEVVEGTRIVKSGMDGTMISITDLVWHSPDADGNSPSVSTVQLMADSFTPVPSEVAQCQVHTAVLDELNHCFLCEIPKGWVGCLTSKDCRLGQVTMANLLLDKLKVAMSVDGVIFNAGGIRAGKQYGPEVTILSMGQLKDEMPFDNDMIVLETPGSVVQEIVKFMRRFALESPPVPKGFYAQLDSGFECDETNNVTHINGCPIVADQMYSIGT